MKYCRIFPAFLLILAAWGFTTPAYAQDLANWSPNWQIITPAPAQSDPTKNSCITVKHPTPETRIHLRTLLPSSIPTDGALFIRSMEQPFEVFVNGTPIYCYGMKDGKIASGLQGFPWHLIRLPQTAAGQTIEFLTGVSRGRGGICKQAILASTAEITQMIALDGWDRIVIALIALIMALAGLGVAIGTRTAKPYVAFSGYALSVGAWILSSTSGPLLKLLWVPSAKFWVVFDLGGLYLTPFFLALFFLQITQGRGGLCPVLHVIQWGHGFFAVAALSLGLAGMISLSSTIGWYNSAVWGFILVSTVESIRRFKTGTLEQRIFASGMVMFFIFGTHDFLVGSGLVHWSRHLSHWGLIGLLGCLAWASVIILRKQTNERAEYAKQAEISALVAEKAKNTMHNLRTPISSLGDKIRSLQEVPQQTKENMISNLTHMRALLSSQLETQSAPAAGVSATAAQPSVPAVSLGVVLNTLKTEFQKTAAGADITWECDIPNWAHRTQLPIVSSELQCALENITNNAFEAAALRAKQVLLCAQLNEKEVQIIVRDFGPGFSDAALQSFEVGGKFTDKQGGHGRGLVSARETLTAAGGELQVHNSGDGATVVVRVPILAKSTMSQNN